YIIWQHNIIDSLTTSKSTMNTFCTVVYSKNTHTKYHKNLVKRALSPKTRAVTSHQKEGPAPPSSSGGGRRTARRRSRQRPQPLEEARRLLPPPAAAAIAAAAGRRGGEEGHAQAAHLRREEPGVQRGVPPAVQHRVGQVEEPRRVRDHRHLPLGPPPEELHEGVSPARLLRGGLEPAGVPQGVLLGLDQREVNVGVLAAGAGQRPAPVADEEAQLLPAAFVGHPRHPPLAAAAG
ncbi:unnamed protein product, partial [Heterosigma akashiwo]